MISSYSTLWTHVSFYVPQDTNAAKSAARKFIKKIKLLGGMGTNNLVVSRGHGCGLLCCDYQKAVKELKEVLPPDAELRLVPVTDKQVEKSQIFWGTMRTAANNFCQ